jgi:hypothetical protein
MTTTPPKKGGKYRETYARARANGYEVLTPIVWQRNRWRIKLQDIGTKKPYMLALSAEKREFPRFDALITKWIDLQ